jgi:hypothetical protein
VIGALLRVYAVTFFLGVSPAYEPTPVTQLPELRDLDLSSWECLSKLEGIAKTQDGKERNQRKNRWPIELTGINIPSFDTAAFLARVADYDRQIEKKHRRDLSPTQKEQVIALEKQIVSVTGWLVLAYQGVPETTNCRSKDFLDWHLELSPESADHPAPGRRPDAGHLRNHAADAGVGLSQRCSNSKAGGVPAAAGQQFCAHWKQGAQDSRHRLSDVGRRAQ